ncbi:MAG: OmpA family protein [Candidatus Sumerlaeota bacterium]|nr:OmpA family protein [Candidatus Sumerlaeota bacterium]
MTRQRREAQAWVDRGMAMNDNSTSETLCYRRAIEVDPRYAAAHFNLAFALQKRDELEQALLEYREVMRLDPRRADAFYNAGALTLQTRRDAQEARACFNRFVELSDAGAKHDAQALDKARGLVEELEREIQESKKPDFHEFYSAEEIVAILTRRITRGGQTIYEARRAPLLLFESNSPELAGDAATRQMTALRDALTDPRLAGKRFAIEGHTDSRGDSVRNLDLSEKRARAVREWLVERGIDAARLETQAFGEDAPAYANDTEQHRRFNRRVEIVEESL